MAHINLVTLVPGDYAYGYNPDRIESYRAKVETFKLIGEYAKKVAELQDAGVEDEDQYETLASEFLSMFSDKVKSEVEAIYDVVLDNWDAISDDYELGIAEAVLGEGKMINNDDMTYLAFGPNKATALAAISGQDIEDEEDSSYF